MAYLIYSSSNDRTLCQRDTRVKWEAPFIPILNTPGLDPQKPRDLGPPSLGHRYTSLACKKGFFSHVPIPEATPCHVSDAEKEDLYKRMVYTTTARRMMNDIPHRENVVSMIASPQFQTSVKYYWLNILLSPIYIYI